MPVIHPKGKAPIPAIPWYSIIPRNSAGKQPADMDGWEEYMEIVQLA